MGAFSPLRRKGGPTGTGWVRLFSAGVRWRLCHVIHTHTGTQATKSTPQGGNFVLAAAPHVVQLVVQLQLLVSQDEARACY